MYALMMVCMYLVIIINNVFKMCVFAWLRGRGKTRRYILESKKKKKKSDDGFQKLHIRNKGE